MDIEGAHWRKSSFSGGGGPGNGNCIEVAAFPDGSIALRDSKNPAGGVICFSGTEVSDWITSIKAGRFDHLG
ncbi:MULTISPECIES: DUF397 domain-containing protein [Actinoalloteichus]|uniref:DUF397 family protein n=1 Tax=Actinoalloteichus fjordicus TaxID=1612552 RepID=A0AAC9PSE0_9PSEU|nr:MULTISPECIES: DUF397 domain-containing protein [Actinoalloteichus]APU14736.1 putative DUF397 family protein [Actinoalloteichus fjordicus]APU20704.1 putative DUF397 family protein [Actinoalloteichus sp. GBA129-24]